MFFEDFDNGRLKAQLSGGRFTVVYRLEGDEGAARARAQDICVEQTVEFPAGLLPAGEIPGQVVGQIEELVPDGDNHYLATISYADETAAGEFTQFLNVVFGNISIKQGIQVAAVCPSGGILAGLRGPRFGVSGLRQMLGVEKRPILFSALKPMGLSAEELATLAGRFVEGGVEIIKDDHGLSNQVFAPFEERVARCAAAVGEANGRYGKKTIYAPNVTAPFEEMMGRAHRAKELGAGGLLVIPGLVGLDAMRALAESDVGLPVFAHPAFIGSYAINSQGIHSRVIFGTLMRMAGADATIFPNYGGRFPLSQEDCLGIAQNAREPLGTMRDIFPAPAGGMELKNIAGMVKSYGSDLLVLVGGGLFSLGDDVVANCRRFLEEVAAARGAGG